MGTTNGYFVAFLFYLAVLNQIIIIRCSSKYTNFNNNGQKLLFVFGDSHYDPGNNQYINFGGGGSKLPFPYGMSLKNHHSTGRISDGLVVPDFIASFANLSFPAAILKPGADFKYGANFASGGGRVLLENVTRPHMNLPMQMDKFKRLVTSMVQKVGEKKTRRVLMRSVHMISIGINDYFSFNIDNPNASDAERKHLVRMVVGNLTAAINEIYAMGGRKFAYQNVGPMGCYPTTRERYPDYNGSCVPRFMNHAYLHNKAISVALRRMARRLPGFKYSLLDYYHALPPRIFNPKKYGFKVGQVACCGSGYYNGAPTCGGGTSGREPYNLCRDPKYYVLFDGSHHTQKTNQELAKLFWDSGAQEQLKLTGPFTIKQLFEFP